MTGQTRANLNGVMSARGSYCKKKKIERERKEKEKKLELKNLKVLFLSPTEEKSLRKKKKKKKLQFLMAISGEDEALAIKPVVARVIKSRKVNQFLHIQVVTSVSGLVKKT